MTSFSCLISEGRFCFGLLWWCELLPFTWYFVLVIEFYCDSLKDTCRFIEEERRGQSRSSNS